MRFNHYNMIEKELRTTIKPLSNSQSLNKAKQLEKLKSLGCTIFVSCLSLVKALLNFYGKTYPFVTVTESFEKRLHSLYGNFL